MAHNQRKHCGPIQAAKRKSKYAAQFARTESNRLRKQARHQRLVEKKARKRASFSIYMSN